MGSPRTSRLRFLDLEGCELAAPSEWEPCLLEVTDGLQGFDNVELTRNGLPMQLRMEKIAGAKRVVAPWPRSDPGRYEVWVGPENPETLSVKIEPQKISTTEFEAMVRELEYKLPATIALSLQQAGALTGVNLISPKAVTLEEEMNRIRRAVLGTPDLPGLASVLPRIAVDPHGMLKTTELWIRRPNVRRPQAAALVRAVAREGNIDTDFRPRQVIDSRVEYTVDVYENRLLKAFVGEVELRLRHLRRSIEKTNAAPLAEAASQCLDTLSEARRSARFLEDVGGHPGAARTTMVFLRRPDYHAAYSSYLTFHRSASVRLWDDHLSAPLENVPSLYETWGTLSVLQALAQFAAKHGFEATIDRVFIQRPGELFLRILPDGKPALRLEHPNGNTIRLIPQRSYSTSGKLRSISFQQKPDIVIEVDRPDGDTRVIIFDPKYKLDSEIVSSTTVTNVEEDPGIAEGTGSEIVGSGKPKKVDIDKMHAYRDSIRDLDDGRAVQYAAILYPGLSVEYGDGIAALAAHPSDETFASALQEVVGEQVSKAIA